MRQIHTQNHLVFWGSTKGSSYIFLFGPRIANFHFCQQTYLVWIKQTKRLLIFFSYKKYYAVRHFWFRFQFFIYKVVFLKNFPDKKYFVFENNCLHFQLKLFILSRAPKKVNIFSMKIFLQMGFFIPRVLLNECINLC